MAELGRSIGHKQAADTNSRRDSDADFSIELEAALKLIQDLESPNTIETPSETFRGIPGARAEKALGSGGSSKTLSGHSSLDGHDGHGKLSSGLMVESQSTSGYNSPTLSDRGTPALDGMSCVIRHVGPTAVISIFPSVTPGSPGGRSERTANDVAGKARRRTHVRTLSAGDAKLKEEGRLKLALVKVRDLLGGRRPSLLPDLERAVLKSESLAFLTDFELEDRLQQTRDVHRVRTKGLGFTVWHLVLVWRC